MEIDRIVKMFKEANTINIRIFLKRHGIYLPSQISFAYIIEEKGNYMFVHIYPSIPVKILVTIDREKGEVVVDWVELPSP